MITIGVQGGKGSFSEEAAHTFAQRQNIKEFEIQYLINSERVLDQVEKNKINYGIIAMENAQGGLVIESTKALAVHRCHIVDMFHILVIQNLLTLPGTRAGDIQAIYSHQQALRQCRQFLAEQFWGCQLIEAEDTAEAARKLKLGEIPATSAVIANKSCADLYGLTLFAENIHDLKKNLTLFLGVTQLKGTE